MIASRTREKTGSLGFTIVRADSSTAEDENPALGAQG
jgi:hypothetical protein